MFNDIVICELMHDDPQNCEFCNPQEIVVGTSNDGGILFSMLFKNEEERKQKYSSVEGEYALEVFAEVINKTATNNNCIRINNFTIIISHN